MAWIKRNLFFVIFGTVAVGLLGFASWYFYDSIQRNEAAKFDLLGKVGKLNELHISEPHPDDANIALIKKDQARVKKLLDDARQNFGMVPQPFKLSDKDFKVYLEGTIAGLTREAAIAGVGLPLPIQGRPYSFAFSTQRDQLQYLPGAIEPWSIQLREITDLCRILYRAKVVHLESIRRISVAAKDYNGGPEFLPMQAATNSLGVFVPYEIAFRGFTTEIAAVLDELQRSTNCYIVKNINVDQSRAQAALVASPAGAALGLLNGGQPASTLRPGATAAEVTKDRYRETKPPPGPGGPGAVKTSTGPQPTVVLSEKPLRVVMLVAVVKLKGQAGTNLAATPNASSDTNAPARVRRQGMTNTVDRAEKPQN